MLLDEIGLKIAAFEPVLAAVLGDATGNEGGKVLTESVMRGRSEIQLRDWLYCLVQAPGTALRKYLVDLPGKRPDNFANLIEDGSDSDDEAAGASVHRLTSESVAPAVREMLARANDTAAKASLLKITDAVLTGALLDTADPGLTELLTLWAGEEGIRRLRAAIKIEAPPPPPLIDDDGNLVSSRFDTSGRLFCRRLAEDAASLGSRQVTSRHCLYTLLGDENGLLSTALAIQGIDVKKQLQSTLSRELTKPGRKRVESFRLSFTAGTGNGASRSAPAGTMFAAVAQVLETAAGGAAGRDAPQIGEFDISRAFVAQQSAELQRLFPDRKVLDLVALREYMDTAEPEEQEETPATRYSVKEIEENIRKRVCGQDAAIQRVLPWIKRLRFGLPRDGRPAAVLLFLGPTGTGKTQVAKELARYVFGDEEMLLFLEMGQFKTKESMSGFIGAPPGYVGYGEGKLTNGLRDKPECVVLFDEIEKADVQVFDTLLRFADEGMISDPAGPIRDGRKCIIVMTTNAGQSWLRENQDKRDSPDLSSLLFQAALEELKKAGFRPEFLGRVDERITFLPFTLETCRLIVDGVLERELEKFLRLKDVSIVVPEEVRALLADRTYERTSDEGARGAPRAVNEFIVTPAIDRLSEGDDAEASRAPLILRASTRGLPPKVILEFDGEDTSRQSIIDIRSGE